MHNKTFKAMVFHHALILALTYVEEFLAEVNMWIGTIENIVLRTGGEPADSVRQGVFVVFDVPFRISSGEVSHFKDMFEGHSADLWILNKIASYSYRTIDEPHRKLPPRKDLASRFALYIQEKQFDEELLRDTVISWDNKIDTTFPKLDLQYIAMRIFERFIIAIRTSCGNCISSPIGDLYQATIWEMTQWICLEYNVIVVGSSPIPDEVIWKLSFQERHMHISSGWSGILKDISEAEKDKIQIFLNDQSDNYFYYELRYRALQMEKAGDWRSALLWDVIALETLVNLFYDYWMDDLGNDDQKASKDEHALWSNVSKDIGLTNLVQLIPYLIKHNEPKPSEEISRNVVAAIKIRNKLTHSLKTRDGEYHARIISNSKLVEARKAVADFSDILLKLIEANSKRK